MHIRLAQTTDAVSVNELLRQLGYAQDDVAATAARIRSWDGDPASAASVADAHGKLLGCARVEVTSAVRRQDAHRFYLRCGYVDQAGRSSRFLRELTTTGEQA